MRALNDFKDMWLIYLKAKLKYQVLELVPDIFVYRGSKWIRRQSETWRLVGRGF